MSRHGQPNAEEPPVVVRDRRKIDPVTGAVRTPDPAAGPVGQPPAGPPGAAPAAPPPAAPAPPTAGGEPDDLQAQLAERTNDLQRVTAEFANYRRRIERDREAVVAAAKAAVVTELLGVLDDVERAGAHGDLNGAFKAVADKLTDTLGKIGLAPFGAEGDPFDPAVHQAVQHSTSPEVSGPTVTAVLRRGYQLGDRLLRTAMVAVTDHEPEAPADNGDHPAGDHPAGDHPAGDHAAEQPLWAAPGVDHNPAQREQD